MKDPSLTIGYRNDLQILRAVAVVLVLLFHLKVPYFQGGFIGVDIFFVLSGYFIARTLPQAGTLRDVAAFYNRRLRRILPLAWIVFLLFMLVAPFVFLPPEIKLLNQDFLAALFLVPNVFYWMDNSYFESSLFRPMLHYWSLGVEYQYYLVFPLALFFMRKVRVSGILFFIASLGLCVVLTELSAKTAFFWMPTRFWEFMLGYCAFRMEGKNSGLHVVWRWLLIIVSLVCFGLCAVFFSAKILFPGYAALVPALGAFLFITAKMGPWPRMFGPLEKVLVGIGTISFSVYLWHYPVIFLLGYAPFSYGTAFDFTQAVYAVFLSFALSIASYFLIEEKFRSLRFLSNKLFYVAMGGLFATSLTVAALFHVVDYGSGLYDSRSQKIFKAVDDRLPYRCGKISKIIEFSYDSCTLHDGGEQALKRVLLAGDSHADAIKPPFLDIVQESGSSFYLVMKNCNPGQDGCPADYFLKEARRRNVTDIVFHGMMREQETYVQLEQIIRSLKDTTIRVHIIDPTPVFEKSIPEHLYTKMPEMIVTQEEYRQQNKDYFAWKLAIEEMWPQVYFYDTEGIYCPTACIYENEDFLYYYDGHHLTVSGAGLLSSTIRRVFE